MCDEITEKDNEEFFLKHGLSRRDLGKDGVAFALTQMLHAGRHGRRLLRVPGKGRTCGSDRLA